MPKGEERREKKRSVLGSILPRHIPVGEVRIIILTLSEFTLWDSRPLCLEGMLTLRLSNYSHLKRILECGKIKKFHNNLKETYPIRVDIQNI